MALLAKMKKVFEAVDTDEALRRAAFESASTWLTDQSLASYRPYIEHLVDNGAGELLVDSFWRMIPFGTGGRRGPVGAGPNRINPYTLSLSIQGHCDFLKQKGARDNALSVVVAYDVRQYFDLRGIYPGVEGILKNLTSRDLARTAAEIYAANDIVAHVIGNLAPTEVDRVVTDQYISTPELSFLIRELGAAGGLNISASHNHPDDNGGKFYNDKGGQEIPPDDETLLKIVEAVTEIKREDYSVARAQNRIRFVPAELHRAYIDMNKSLCPSTSRSARVAFTPLSGTGSSTVLEALSELAFEVKTVASQAKPDGSFKNVRYRIGNPEVPESMDALETLALTEGCDIGFATDPDADRLGMIYREGNGTFSFVSGNQIGVLLVESILQTLRRNDAMPPNPFFANTVVTSSLQRRIAKAYGCQVVGDLMVGCKYMADVIRRIEANGRYPDTDFPDGRDAIEGTVADYVFSCEESHGYLVSPRVRDKDACGAAVHLAGLVSRLKDERKTLSDMLDDIYRVYGYVSNRQRSLVMEGIVGLERISRIQKELRKSPPASIAGRARVGFTDFQAVGGPLQSSTDAASRNVLLFELENGKAPPIRLIVRPSGTEPKTKIYVEVPAESRLGGTLYDASPSVLSSVTSEALAGVKRDADASADEIATAFIRHCLGPSVLGSTYPDIPETALMVSDLVSVDRRIQLITHILPNLVIKIKGGEDEVSLNQWLSLHLVGFGEGPFGMIRNAVSHWVSENISELDDGETATLLRLLRVSVSDGGCSGT